MTTTPSNGDGDRISQTVGTVTITYFLDTLAQSDSVATEYLFTGDLVRLWLTFDWYGASKRLRQPSADSTAQSKLHIPTKGQEMA